MLGANFFKGTGEVGKRVRLPDYSVTVTFLHSALAGWFSVSSILSAAHFFSRPPGILLCFCVWHLGGLFPLRLLSPAISNFQTSLLTDSLETAFHRSLWPPPLLCKPTGHLWLPFQDMYDLAGIWNSKASSFVLTVFIPSPALVFLHKSVLSGPSSPSHLLAARLRPSCQSLQSYPLYVPGIAQTAVDDKGSVRFKPCLQRVYRPVIVHSHPNLVYSDYASVKAGLITFFVCNPFTSIICPHLYNLG